MIKFGLYLFLSISDFLLKLFFFQISCYLCKIRYKVDKNEDQLDEITNEIYWYHKFLTVILWFDFMVPCFYFQFTLKQDLLGTIMLLEKLRNLKGLSLSIFNSLKLRKAPKTHGFSISIFKSYIYFCKKLFILQEILVKNPVSHTFHKNQIIYSFSNLHYSAIITLENFEFGDFAPMHLHVLSKKQNELK